MRARPAWPPLAFERHSLATKKPRSPALPPHSSASRQPLGVIHCPAQAPSLAWRTIGLQAAAPGAPAAPQPPAAGAHTDPAHWQLLGAPPRATSHAAAGQQAPGGRLQGPRHPDQPAANAGSCSLPAGGPAPRRCCCRRRRCLPPPALPEPSRRPFDFPPPPAACGPDPLAPSCWACVPEAWHSDCEPPERLLGRAGGPRRCPPAQPPPPPPACAQGPEAQAQPPWRARLRPMPVSADGCRGAVTRTECRLARPVPAPRMPMPAPPTPRPPRPPPPRPCPPALPAVQSDINQLLSLIINTFYS